MHNKQTIHWAWIILGVCFVNLFINYSVRLGYGVVLPEIIRDLGLGRVAGGSIFNAYLFSYITLTPLAGYMTDRLGARPVITACCLILGIGVLMMGTIQTLLTACLFYAIAGLGATGMWTPVITVVQRWFAPNRRGLALGILSTGYGLGFATMGAVFPWIVLHFNWRYTWYFLGSGALVMVLANGLLLKNAPERSGYRPWGEKHDSSPPGDRVEALPTMAVSLSTVLKDSRFWFIGLSYFSITYGLYGITTFMVDYAQNQMGLILERASLLATVHGSAQIVGVLTILPLSDYLGRKQTIIVSNAFITACLIGILFSGKSTTAFFILVGVMAVFYGITFPIYGACAGDYFPREVMGTVIGAWTPFYGLGAISVHWLAGTLRDTTGVYYYAFIINAAMAAIGLFLMCLVRKK